MTLADHTAVDDWLAQLGEAPAMTAPARLQGFKPMLCMASFCL